MAADLTAVLGADTSQLRSEIKSAKESLKGYKSEVDKLSGSNSNSTKAIDKARNAIHQQSQTYKGAKIQVKKLEESIKDLEWQYSHLGSKKSAFAAELGETMQAAKEKVKSLKQEIADFDLSSVGGKSNPIVDNLKEASAEATTTKGNIQSMVSALSKSKSFSGLTSGISNAASKAGVLQKALGFISTGTLGRALVALTGPIGAIVAGLSAVAAVAKKAYDYGSEVGNKRTKTYNFTGNESSSLTDYAAIEDLANNAGADITLAMRAATAATKEFGVTWGEAISMMQQGLVTGANADGQMMENIREYSTQMARAGVTYQEFIGLMAQGQQMGVFNDKAIDSIKDAALNIEQMTTETAKAINAIGLDAEDMGTQIKMGILKPKDAIRMIAARIKELPEGIEKANAITKVFGAVGEDAGVKWIESLADMDKAWDKTKAKMTETQKATVNLNNASSKLKTAWTTLFSPLQKGFESFTNWINNAIADFDRFAAKALRGISITILGEKYVENEEEGLAPKKGRGSNDWAKRDIKNITAAVYRQNKGASATEMAKKANERLASTIQKYKDKQAEAILDGDVGMGTFYENVAKELKSRHFTEANFYKAGEGEKKEPKTTTTTTHSTKTESKPDNYEYTPDTKAFTRALRDAMKKELEEGVQVYYEEVFDSNGKKLHSIGDIKYGEDRKPLKSTKPEEELRGSIQALEDTLEDGAFEMADALKEGVKTIQEAKTDKSLKNGDIDTFNKIYAPKKQQYADDSYIPIKLSELTRGTDFSNADDRAQVYDNFANAFVQAQDAYYERAQSIAKELKPLRGLLAKYEKQYDEGKMTLTESENYDTIKRYADSLEEAFNRNINAAISANKPISWFGEGADKARLHNGQPVKAEKYLETGNYNSDIPVERYKLVPKLTKLQELWKANYEADKEVAETLSDLALLGVNLDENGDFKWGDVLEKNYKDLMTAIQNTLDNPESAEYDESLVTELKNRLPDNFKKRSFSSTVNTLIGLVINGMASKVEEEALQSILKGVGKSEEGNTIIKADKSINYFNTAKKRQRKTYDTANVAQTKFDARNANWDAFKGIVSGTETAVNAIDSVKSSWDSFKDALEEGDAYKTVIAGFNAMMSPIKAFIEVYEMVNTLIKIFGDVQTASAAKAVAASNAKQAANATEMTSTMSKTAVDSAAAVTSATKSGASLPFPANIAAIAAGVAAVVAALSMVGSFADGGIIQGASKVGDMNLARVNGGEMILNGSQQARLFSLLNGNTSSPSSIKGEGNVNFRIKGKQLVGVLDNYSRKQSRL